MFKMGKENSALNYADVELFAIREIVLRKINVDMSFQL